MNKAADTIKNCLKSKKMLQIQLAALLGEDVRYINQQLNRQKDIKVERFTDVLEHIGYRVEVIDNDGIRKVCHESAQKVIKTSEPKGLFWTFADGIFTGIDSRNSKVLYEEFSSKEECFKWLIDKIGGGMTDV